MHSSLTTIPSIIHLCNDSRTTFNVISHGTERNGFRVIIAKNVDNCWKSMFLWLLPLSCYRENGWKFERTVSNDEQVSCQKFKRIALVVWHVKAQRSQRLHPVQREQRVSRLATPQRLNWRRHTDPKRFYAPISMLINLLGLTPWVNCLTLHGGYISVKWTNWFDLKG